MLNMLSFTRPLALAALVALAAPVQSAENQSHVFTLYIKGFKAGTIATKARKTDTGYSLAGSVAPTRFLRLLRDVGYKGTVTGSYKGQNYRPAKYTGNIKTGSRTSTVKMRFVRGKPIVDSYLPSREKRAYDLVPGAQKGTIDLLTAVHILFEDKQKADLCGRTIPMFDGRRRSKLTLAKPKIKGGDATCSGKYTRVAGFSPEDMQKKVNFPFTLVYKQMDEGKFRLMSFHTETTFGTAKAVRN